jgi:hypothetical protein
MELEKTLALRGLQSEKSFSVLIISRARTEPRRRCPET